MRKWELIKQSKLLKINSKFPANLFNEKYGLELEEFNHTTGTERINISKNVFGVQVPLNVSLVLMCYICFELGEFNNTTRKRVNILEIFGVQVPLNVSLILICYIYFVVDYTYVGCFKDNSTRRVMPSLIGRYIAPGTEIASCANRARALGYKVFGIQNGTDCWSGAKAHRTYAKYKYHTNCKHGKGGLSSNAVYLFNCE